ncbi:MAG: type II secretion system F family protein [archaeon]
MIQNLGNNIMMERNIARELFTLSQQYNSMMQEGHSEFNKLLRKQEEKILLQTINSLVSQLKIINNSIPEVLKGISGYKQLPGSEKSAQNLVSLNYQPVFSRLGEEITIKKEDMGKFRSEVAASKETIKRLKKHKGDVVEQFAEFKGASNYGRLANSLFLRSSISLLKAGYFKRVSKDLRQANLAILQSTYVSMILLSTLLAGILGILAYVFFIFFSLSLEFPFISVAVIESSRFVWNLQIILALPLLTFLALYFYPGSEAMSLKRKIEQELPFVTIHMSAIAGSGIEPSQIFKIIAMSSEYKYTRGEIRKVINQINVYGYDLFNALKNSARATSSPKLAELFKGLATTIRGGGDLISFLEKRAESLLLDYKLEREKYSKVAETFMDIYISVVIAAPMIMMLLLVLINISGISVGLTMMGFTLVIIVIVVLINLMFLVFLHLKQPSY